MSKKLESLPKSQAGATAVEYGLIVALIIVAIAGVLVSVGGGLNGKFTTLSGLLGG